jgi:hypothetical protein
MSTQIYVILKMEALCSSKTLISAYKTVRLHNPEKQDQQLNFNIRNNAEFWCKLVRQVTRRFSLLIYFIYLCQ